MAVACASITLYAAKLTQISPVYVVYLILVPICTILAATSRRLHVTSEMLWLVVLLLYITVSNIEYLFTGSYINILIGALAYFFIRAFTERYPSSIWMKLLAITNISAIFFLTIDSVYRFSYPSAPTEEALNVINESEYIWFYQYKFGSIMFADSNTTGLIAMVLLFVSIYSRFLIKKRLIGLDTIALVVLTLLSLSRAAIVATIIGVVFFYCKHIIRMNMAWVAALLAAALPLAITVDFAENYINKDESFNSKLYIASAVIDYLAYSDTIDALFGVGLEESTNLLGIYTHIIYLTYIVETGFIGFILFSFFWAAYIRKFGLTVLVPIITVSFSYFLYLGAPFLFVPLALLANIQSNLSTLEAMG